MQTATLFLSLVLPVIALAAPQLGYGYEQQPFFAQRKANGHGNSNGSGNGNKYLPPPATTPAPIVRKQFYLISAPEDQENLSRSKHFVIGRPQKNYRVVFIKAPSSDNANLRLSAEFAPQEEKTVIYVLSKKDNELNVDDIATPPPTQPSKPEVYFIKYKTNDEAQAAQKEIQDQYDQLGGTNEYSNEGTAPITSVIGSLDGLTPNGAYDYRKIQSGTGSSVLSQYLPPVTR